MLAEIGLEWLRRQGAVPKVPSPLPRDVSVLDGMRKAVAEQAAGIEADRDFMRTVFTRSRLFAPEQGRPSGATPIGLATGRRRGPFSRPSPR